MENNDAVARLAKLLRELRLERRISMLQLADEARVNVSVVFHAENGRDARLSTWERLFRGLGYELILDATELAEECGTFLEKEAERRRDRRFAGLCAGKRRFW